MLIAEELLLLALNPHTGKMRTDAQHGLPVALAGVLIGELRLEGALDVQGRRFIATGARPPHPLLAAAQQALAEPQGQTFTDQLRRLDWRMGKLCPLPAGVPQGPPSRRAVASPTSCAGKTGGAACGCYWSMG